jgi:hypothetical protein
MDGWMDGVKCIRRCLANGLLGRYMSQWPE